MDALPYIELPEPPRSRDGVERPEQAANRCLAFAKKTGVLASEYECCMCSRPFPRSKTHLHHEDYAHIRRVTPLCGGCHRRRHKALGWGVSGIPKSPAHMRRKRMVTLDPDVAAKVAAFICPEYPTFSKAGNALLRRAFNLPEPVTKPKAPPATRTTLTFSLTKDLKVRINAAAKELGIAPSELVRRIAEQSTLPAA